MSTKTDKPEQEVPNPSEENYHDTFDSIVGQPDMQALDDRGNAIARDHELPDLEKQPPPTESEEAKAEKNAISESAGESLYKPSPEATDPTIKKSRRQKFTGFIRNHKVSSGATVATGVGIGLLIAGFMAIQPFQILQISKLLSGFGFDGTNNSSEDRLGRAYRYLKYPDQREMRRLGKVSMLSRRSVKKFEAKLGAQGMEPVFERGRLVRIEIDPANEGKFRASGVGGEFEVKAGTVDTGGRRYIEIDPFGGRANTARANIMKLKTGLKNLDVKPGVLGARVLKIKAGVNFANVESHRLAQNAKVKYDTYREKKRAAIREGAKPAGSVTSTGDSGNVDPDGNKIPETDSIDVNSEPEIKSRVNKAAKGVAVVGLVCAAYQIVDSASELRTANVVLPLIRTGARYMSLGTQLQSGQVDIDEIGFATQDLYDASAEKSERSWNQAREVQYLNGQPATGPSLPNEAHPTNAGNPVIEIFRKIGGEELIGKACGFVTNRAVGWTVDLLSGGITAVVLGEIQNAVIASSGIVEWMVSSLAGTQIKDDVTGAVLGSYTVWGSLLGGNEHALTFGGRELTDQEQSKQQAYLRDKRLAEFKKKPLLARLFSPREQDSITSTALMSLPATRDPRVALSGMASFAFSNTVSTPQMYAGALTGTAKAQGSSSFKEVFGDKVKQVGFSQAELNDERYENPFENEDKVINDIGLDKDRVRDCFGFEVDDEGGLTPVPQGTRYLSKARDEAAGCNDTSEDWTRVRFYIMDVMTLEAENCYNGEADSCQLLGFDTPTATATTADGAADSEDDTDDVPCDSRTVEDKDYKPEDGAYLGYADGKPRKIKICIIPNISSLAAGAKVRVNSTVSKNFYELAEAASAAGHPLVVNGLDSSFRTMEQQKRLYDDAPQSSRDNGLVAEPGKSNHQMGFAIDFNFDGLGTGSAAMSGRCLQKTTQKARCELPESGTWTWMNNNASTHGISQLWKEYWHWGTREVSTPP